MKLYVVIRQPDVPYSHLNYRLEAFKIAERILNDPTRFKDSKKSLKCYTLLSDAEVIAAAQERHIRSEMIRRKQNPHQLVPYGVVEIDIPSEDLLNSDDLAVAYLPYNYRLKLEHIQAIHIKNPNDALGKFTKFIKPNAEDNTLINCYILIPVGSSVITGHPVEDAAIVRKMLSTSPIFIHERHAYGYMGDDEEILQKFDVKESDSSKINKIAMVHIQLPKSLLQAQGNDIYRLKDPSYYLENDAITKVEIVYGAKEFAPKMKPIKVPGQQEESADIGLDNLTPDERKGFSKNNEDFVNTISRLILDYPEAWKKLGGGKLPTGVEEMTRLLKDTRTVEIHKLNGIVEEKEMPNIRANYAEKARELTDIAVNRKLSIGATLRDFFGFFWHHRENETKMLYNICANARRGENIFNSEQNIKDLNQLEESLKRLNVTPQVANNPSNGR